MLNTTKLSDKELKQLASLGDSVKSQTICNFKTQTDYINENYSDCLKQLVFEMKKHLTTIFTAQQLTSSTNVLQQLNAIVTSNSLSFNNSNNINTINNNNELVLYLLKTTQNLTACLDSIQSKNTIEPLRQINANTTVFFNNLALVHHSLQKHSLSSLYFQKALNENTKFITKCLSPKTSDGAKKKDEQIDSNYIDMLLMNRRNELLFNLGISLLLSKQPVAAFECLFKVSKVYGQNSRLWLRLAECCLMCYRHSVIPNSSNDLSDLQTSHLDSTQTASNNEKILKLSEKIKCIQRSFGSGFHHKIQFGTNLTNDLAYNSLAINDLKKNKDDTLVAKLITLEFAYMCLRNSLKLIPSNQQIFSNSSIKTNSDLITQLKSLSTSKLNQKQNENNLEEEDSTTEFDTENDQCDNPSTTSNNTVDSDQSPRSRANKQQLNYAQTGLFNCVWPSKPLNLSELQNLKSSILVAISYVSLCLKDYSSTIKYCNVLLSPDDLLNMKCPISKGNKYLAHFYIAEALLYSDKISDSIENLNINTKIESDNDISFVPIFNTEIFLSQQQTEANEEKIRSIKSKF